RPAGPRNTVSLEKYRQKRSADTTPEPFGRASADRPHLFVVQKHAATRLHYDFRLEWDGVLKSWAVPQGPSADPAEKRLAVEVEDHPVEYADFEGVIPEGNYGAGEVIVWDQGKWTPLADLDEGMKKGKLLFELSGYKLRGRWTLVRMKTKGKTTGKEWLLIKERDGFAKKGRESSYPEESIFSGRTVEDLAAGANRAAAIRDEAERLGAPARDVRVAQVQPMLAETRDAAFTRPGWIWELKYDGFRLIAGREEGKPALRYRHGMDSTGTFPEIARAVGALPAERFVLDGEVVVLDERSRPRFGLLQQRALLQRRTDIERAAVELPATFFAFDLLAFEGLDLRTLPLSQRKALLQRFLPRAGPVRYADDVPERGEDLFAAAGELGLEGVVGKKADSPYRGARSADWVKVRLDRTGDFAVVGFTKPEGARSGFGALHLAYRGDAGLVYAGRVGTGFSGRLLDELYAKLSRAVRPTPAFEGSVPTGRGHVWVEPELVVEVRYKEWTRDDLLRHPVFLRVRDDKRVDECARDDAPGGGEPPAPPAPLPRSEPEERIVPFSNLDKVFWPDEGFTKGDLIDYYRAISPWLLPYLADRPLVMTRYPDGIAGKSFFQKDAPHFAPDWIRLERIWSEHAEREIDYFVCDDVESLLYVANLGSIPLHVWASRVAAPERPDWCILDLDPKGAPFSHVVAIARAIHALCDEIGLPNFIKTSGATGLHVLLPLGGQCTHSESRVLGEILARAVEKHHGDIATTARMLGARAGKVYVDYLQNGHGKTIAGPFSARPVPGATCSAPLKWSEVNAKLDPKDYTIKTLPARMKRLKEDPLASVLTAKPDLQGALAALTARLSS
ncbi:MAG TPA: DNA ligase D, partial [Thermoanaerobaculia bacterium]|nr:DNA ligase D [Thermoanaerobaculia bacterium]